MCAQGFPSKYQTFNQIDSGNVQIPMPIMQGFPCCFNLKQYEKDVKSPLCIKAKQNLYTQRSSPQLIEKRNLMREDIDIDAFIKESKGFMKKKDISESKCLPQSQQKNIQGIQYISTNSNSKQKILSGRTNNNNAHSSYTNVSINAFMIPKVNNDKPENITTKDSKNNIKTLFKKPPKTTSSSIHKPIESYPNKCPQINPLLSCAVNGTELINNSNKESQSILVETQSNTNNIPHKSDTNIDTKKPIECSHVKENNSPCKSSLKENIIISKEPANKNISMPVVLLFNINEKTMAKPPSRLAAEFIKKAKPRIEKTKKELLEYRKKIMKSSDVIQVKASSDTKAKPKSKLLERLAMGERAKVTKKEMIKLTTRNYMMLPEIVDKIKKKEDALNKKEELKIRKNAVAELEKVI